MTILRCFVELGFIELGYRSKRSRYAHRYVPIYQPIPLRPPRRRNFWHMTWQISEKWNREWDND